MNLTTGTISTDPANETDIVNKKYVDNVKSTLNNNISEAISRIDRVNLTTGTISTTPANDTDISNKKYVDDSSDTLRAICDSIYVRYDDTTYELIRGVNKLVLTDLKMNNITSTNSTTTDLTINNSLLVSQDIADVKLSTCSILNSEFGYIIIFLGVMIISFSPNIFTETSSLVEVLPSVYDIIT